MRINWFKINYNKLLPQLKEVIRSGDTIKYFCLLNYLSIGEYCKDCGEFYKTCYCSSNLDLVKDLLIEQRHNNEKIIKLSIFLTKIIMNKITYNKIKRFIKDSNRDENYKKMILGNMK